MIEPCLSYAGVYVSMSLHSALLSQNMSLAKQQICLLDELKIINMCECFAVLHYVRDIE